MGRPLDFSARHWVACGDCIEVMAKLPPNSVDSIVTDPPYGIGFLGKDWDEAVPGDAFAKAALRVLKPGGHLIAFAATRTVHRLAVALEDAGFEVRDMIAWVQWMGMPHSLDISKSIDKLKHHRAEVLEVCTWVREAREAAGLTNKDIDDAFGFNGMAGHWTSKTSQPLVPYLEQVPKLLEVLGVEDPPPRIRKLLLDINAPEGQPGRNWWKREVTGQHAIPHAMKMYLSKHEASAPLSVHTDGGNERRDNAASNEARQWQGWGTGLKPAQEPAVMVRKPFAGGVTHNVLEHGVGALNIDACRHLEGDTAWPGPQAMNHDAIQRQQSTPTVNFSGAAPGHIQPTFDERGRWPANLYQCPKPPPSEKGAGVNHPTVKPVGLMRWLVRLVTPPGGTVLEPFAGSGSTLVAAEAEGFRVIAIENVPTYCDIIKARMAQVAPELEALRRGKAETGF